MVVVTGAAGSIGRAVAAPLRARWDLRETDRRAGGEVAELDVTDLAACRSAFADADAVVHLAAVADPESSWEQLLPANVVGAWTVARAAVDCGVRRLVLASSLQVVAGTPDGTQVRAADRPCPVNLYGATKAWAEALGSWVAATSSTSTVALRIGYFGVDRPAPGSVTRRERSSWLSGRDAAELLRAAVEADVRCVVVNGVSANRHCSADLQDAQAVLGYAPVDDVWTD